MQQIFKEIRESLLNGNLNVALFITLTIPDICLSMKIGKHFSADYENWFNENMPDNYKKFITGKDCYAFRCAILHEGSSDVLRQSKKDIIEKFEILSKPESSHLIYMGGVINYNGFTQPKKLLINIHIFCHDLISSAEKFIEKNNLENYNFVEIKEAYDDGFMSIV